MGSGPVRYRKDGSPVYKPITPWKGSWAATVNQKSNDLTCGGCTRMAPGRPGVCGKYGLNLSGTLERLEVCKAEDGKECRS